MSSMPRCHGIVPARYASSRFPGKPLVEILGKPMFWHVCIRAMRCPELQSVHLATDDERILQAARALDIPVLMTAPDHPSGTDRIHEAACALGLGGSDVVVNIQGDEPALAPAMLSQLLAPFTDPTVCATTLAHRIPPERAKIYDQVKVVWTNQGDALYFSRSVIPHGAEADQPIWGHIGMYAYRFATLERFTSLAPGTLEQCERLEQLRLLENGIPIRVVPTEYTTRGVDRPSDIEAVQSLMTENS